MSVVTQLDTHAYNYRARDSADTLNDVSRFVDDIRRVRSAGRLRESFRPDDVRRACPGWADHTYGGLPS